MSTTTFTSAPAGTWSADPVHSNVGFEIDYAGTNVFRGGFNDWAVTLEDGVLEGSAKVASVDVKDEQLNGHLQTPDFFDAERFPEITFTASELRQQGQQLVAKGELTMRGVTQPIEATGTIAGPAQYFDGKDRIAIELETVVDRTAYGINWNAPIPSGGNALADDVTITVELQLVRPSEG